MNDDANKVRRIAQLSLHCIANIACYRAGWIDSEAPPKLKNSSDFWVRVNGNFLDAGTLNWCILFADEDKGKHDWKKAFGSRAGLNEDLYSKMSLTEQEFNEQLLAIKRYRDKYLAHMDNPSLVFYPQTQIMLSSATYLFGLIKSDPVTKSFLAGIYDDAESHYEAKFAEAAKFIPTALA